MPQVIMACQGITVFLLLLTAAVFHCCFASQPSGNNRPSLVGPPNPPINRPPPNPTSGPSNLPIPGNSCSGNCILPPLQYFGKTYNFVECPLKSWFDARNHCQQQFGGDLLFIRDVDERDRIAFTLLSWFGGKTFGWWIANLSDGNSCSALFNNFQFKRVDCSFPLRFICMTGDFFSTRPVFDVFVPNRE